ncbi:unnamed protein product [Lampetra fluviatilis]
MASAPAEIVVVGSCMTDLVSYAPRLPRVGETVHGHRFAVGFGGKGANQCVQAARLGASTAMVAKVGKDTFGDNYIQNFKDNGVNIDHVGQVSEAATGVAPITVDDEGRNAIVIVPGANLSLGPEDVALARAAIAGARVVLAQLEVRPETTAQALRLARQHGVRTILNPAPAVPDLDPELYELSDIFCPNETEAELVTGVVVSGVEEAGRAATLLLERGCGAVVITLGRRGAVVASRSDPSPRHVPSPSVTAVDTTGAGDSFVGSLAFFQARLPGLPLAEAARRACHIAAESVRSAGTQSSYPARAALPAALFQEQ